jgi:uncharacterized damage-inducible protein DinB
MTITTGYVRMMAGYNSEMNRRLYQAAGRLDDAARRADRGAFWGSIHGTFAHLIWADRQWMSRFDGWGGNTRALAESGTDPRSFPELRSEREEMDRRLEDWAARVVSDWLEGELTWFSGAAGREVNKPVALLVSHFFNHQTHHRGQAHALITAAGERTDATDLWVIV